MAKYAVRNCCAFTQPIEGLIASLREGRIKWKDLEVTLKRDLDDVRESVETRRLVTHATLPAPNESPTSDLMSLAQIAPRAAILEAWVRLEANGAEIARKLDGDDLPKQLRPSMMFGEILRRQSLIPTEVIKAITKLKIFVIALPT